MVDHGWDDNLLLSRFDFESNLAQATRHGERRSAYWPPAPLFHVLTLDLSRDAPLLPARFYASLALLRELVEHEWHRGKASGVPARETFERAGEIAAVMREAADELPHPVDRTHLRARADCVEQGYTEELLAQLVSPDAEVAVFAAPLSTWFGKEIARRPSAFAATIDHSIADGLRPLQESGALATYLAHLRAGLTLNPSPAFVPSRLFFMAGEGNRHPKHIAYFLPEDEGVKRSPFKKTYYFANTHQRILEGVSYPLFDEMVDLGARREFSMQLARLLPAAGVYGHELGHSVVRDSTRYADLNRRSRWISVAMQEVGADVFGTLFVAQCWNEALGATPHDAIAYYLAECLRYVHRGLGFFPDSDGMLLQLNYLHDVGALSLDDGPVGPRLRGEPHTVIAGLRSLARVLADSLLDNQPDLVVRLFERYGPANKALMPLLKRLGALPTATVEYLEEHI
jgi:hypothetical protein